MKSVNHNGRNQRRNLPQHLLEETFSWPGKFFRKQRRPLLSHCWIYALTVIIYNHIHFLFCSKSAKDFFHLIFAHRVSRLLNLLCNDVSNWIHTVVIIQKERLWRIIRLSWMKLIPLSIYSQNLSVPQNWREKLKIGCFFRSILIDFIISKLFVQMFTV